MDSSTHAAAIKSYPLLMLESDMCGLAAASLSLLSSLPSLLAKDGKNMLMLLYKGKKRIKLADLLSMLLFPFAFSI